MKPKLLAALLGRRMGVEAKVDGDDALRKDVSVVRKVIRSQALTQIFVLVAKGMGSPTHIAKETGKSKFAVSLELSELRKARLVRQSSAVGFDLRYRRYEVAWERVAQVFIQDHALELEIYENHLFTQPGMEFRGTISEMEVAILGSGKVGLVKKIVPEEHSFHASENPEKVSQRMNRLVWEFVELFKGYVTERRFDTLREYFLECYKELADSHGRLPKTSELSKFYGFVNESFTKIKPIEEVWKRSVSGRRMRKKRGRVPLYYTRVPRSFGKLVLFSEAGGTDHKGNYYLNPEAKSAIKPGTRLRIYPSYTYVERNLL
jgi:DNA-binding transcriptional ArsR family regulator